MRVAVRPRTVVALVALASGVAQAFGRFSYAILLPAIDRDLLGSYALAGLVGTANVAAYLLGTVVVSATARRADPTAMIRWGLCGSLVGLLVLWRAEGAVALAVGLSLTGVAGAFIWVPAPGLAGSVVRPSRRGAAIGWAGSGIGLGIVFASALAALLASRGGDATWRTVYLVESVLAGLALALCMVLLRPQGSPAAAEVVRSGALRRVPGWASLVGGYTAYGLAYSIYTSYLVSALEDDSGFSRGHAAGVYTLVGVALIFGGVLLGRLSDRWGRGRLLVVGYLVMGASILLALVGAEPFAAVSALAFGVTMSGLAAVIAAHLSDTLTPREFAGAFGRCTLAFGMAQVLGPPLGGWLAETTGSFVVPFLVGAAVAGVGAVLSLGVVRASRKPESRSVTSPGTGR
ncbi:MAG: putative arabinose efflux permease, family [Frankiales bacterium]|nr:putative arabinose efflux permease, family [Frankiales bacterium]